MKKKSTLADLREDVARLSGKVEDGLAAGVKMLEKRMDFLARIQWWQLGVMAALIGIVLSGLVLLWQNEEARTEKMLDKLQQHIEQTASPR